MDLVAMPSLQKIRIFIEHKFLPSLWHIPEKIESLELIVNNLDVKILPEKIKKLD
jgi:hypothetical protein